MLWPALGFITLSLELISMFFQVLETKIQSDGVLISFVCDDE